MRNDANQRLSFCKMSGAGNDFILINVAKTDSFPDPGKLASLLCPRRTAVGADGLVLVEPSQRANADVRVRFWNPDGREAETCGNGTRCAARFAVIEGLATAKMLIETRGSDIEARVAGELVTLRYRSRPTIDLDFKVSAAERSHTGHRVEIGIPHLVLPVERLPADPIEPFCQPLRHAPELGERGANVHLVEVLDRHRVRIRSYERGVEEETLACGSGSMSAAVALCAAGAVDAPVAVETRSGDVLTVRFQRESASFSDLELEGPARVIYWGELSDSDIPIGS